MNFLRCGTEMATGFTAVGAEMATEFAAVREEIGGRTDSLATQMRVLHEDVIALLQEGLLGPGRRKPRKK